MNEAPFISLPLYTAANTTTPPPTTTTTATATTSYTVNGETNRPKNPTASTCFRLLCHASRIGGVIGKSGIIIKKLQHDSSARIRVEDPPPGSDDRVISVVASSSVNRTMSFDKEGNGEVSDAQEALVRVFERVFSVAAEDDGGCFVPGGVVSCRLLVDRSLVGSVIGKGGKVVEKIKKDTGCKIRVLGRDKLSSCAMSNDEMVEIEGDIIAIKKALVAVTGRLQDCPFSDNARTVLARPYNGIPRETTLTNGYIDFPPARTPALEPTPAGPVNHALKGRPTVPLDANTRPSMDPRNSQHEIVFRILSSSDRVGGVIGKSGTIIRALQNESGASISIEAPVPNCDEQIITITATESPDSRSSPAQNAVILVFNRCVETGFEKGLEMPSARAAISARLLIPANQMGCLLGKGGSIIADMRKVTGAVIKIVDSHQVTKWTLEAEKVVLMTGEFVNVRDALYSVTGRLRNNIFTSRTSSGTYGRGNGPMVTPHQFNQQTPLTQSMDNLRLYNNMDHPSLPVLCQSQSGSGNPMNGQDVGRASTSIKGGIELGRGDRSAIVRNTTVEIVVPENVIELVYGENQTNLTRLRQISGAKVVVHEGTREHIVVISGSPEETQSAQSLLQAFILGVQDH